MSDYVLRSDYEHVLRARDLREAEAEQFKAELEKSREFVKTLRKEQEELRKEHEAQKEKLANNYLQRLAESDQRWAEKHATTLLRQGLLVERLDKLIDAALPRPGVEPAPSTREAKAGCSCGGGAYCEC